MATRISLSALAISALLVTAGCSGEPETQTAPAGANRESASEPTANGPAATSGTSGKSVYFGDLHIHTKYSFDAFIFNVRATPDDAYRFAKGETIAHPAGFGMTLSDGPLDFLAVTDHAEYLGVLEAMSTPGTKLSEVPYAPELFTNNTAQVLAAFQRIGGSVRSGEKLDELNDRPTELNAWQNIIASAEKHNDPGTFTTFTAYEYTLSSEGRNLHRNVIFRDDQVPELPFSSFDSVNPEDLWRWLDAEREKGHEGLAIPHNSNGSDGLMFDTETYAGAPLDAAYADLRMRNEPLTEITQVKGTSETHPLLSPNDEWAGFEIMDSYIAEPTLVTNRKGGYVRDAYNTGLEYEAAEGFNPYRFGLVGASDTHTAAGAFDETNYWSKVGIADATPVLRGSVPPEGQDWSTYEVPLRTRRLNRWGASGLTGVWAEENTREAIYGAFRRKETFATSGPRLKVRLFAAENIRETALSAPDAMTQLAEAATPMGGTLDLPTYATPQLLVWAAQDPASAKLDRVQIVKGWIEDGEAQEKVFDVVCADGRVPDPDTARCPGNGAEVNTETCAIDMDKGAAELKTIWRDPEYTSEQMAYYYVRVLENPTCRWSNWDAIRTGRPHNPDLPKVIQERAWSSPVWVR